MNKNGYIGKQFIGGEKCYGKFELIFLRRNRNFSNNRIKGEIKKIFWAKIPILESSKRIFRTKVQIFQSAFLPKNFLNRKARRIELFWLRPEILQ